MINKGSSLRIVTFIYLVYFKYTVNTITTVKLERTTKKALDSLRSSSDSYDLAIKKLIAQVKQQSLKAELIEAYTKKAKTDLEILEDWEPASQEVEHYE